MADSVMVEFVGLLAHVENDSELAMVAPKCQGHDMQHASCLVIDTEFVRDDGTTVSPDLVVAAPENTHLAIWRLDGAELSVGDDGETRASFSDPEKSALNLRSAHTNPPIVPKADCLDTKPPSGAISCRVVLRHGCLTPMVSADVEPLTLEPTREEPDPITQKFADTFRYTRDASTALARVTLTGAKSGYIALKAGIAVWMRVSNEAPVLGEHLEHFDLYYGIVTPDVEHRKLVRLIQPMSGRPINCVPPISLG